MKKTILILLMITGTTAGFSQGFSFGVKAGANFSKESAKASFQGTSISATSDNYTSLLAGVYGTFMLSKSFGIQPELLYSAIGAKGDDGNGGTYTTKTNYLSIPVLARYQIIPLVNLHAGPQFGVLLSAKDQDGTNQKDQVKSSDFGFVIGGGVDLPIGLNFSVRYVAGLSNIAKPDDFNTKIKTQTFQLAVGYKIFGK